MLALATILIGSTSSHVDQDYLNGMLFDHAAIAAARPKTVLSKVLMTDKGLKTDGAVCLDGTDAGFYFVSAADPSKSTSWQLYFEGGGWCYDEEDCYDRSFTGLGSSTSWPSNMTAGGIMSGNCTINPDFCNFNRVVMKYCDGDSFASERSDAVAVNGKPLYFRGQRILKAVLSTLHAKYNLGEATEVLLTGCSAGGLAAFLHADAVHAAVKSIAPHLHRFKVRSQISHNLAYYPTISPFHGLPWPSMASATSPPARHAGRTHIWLLPRP